MKLVDIEIDAPDESSVNAFAAWMREANETLGMRGLRGEISVRLAGNTGRVSFSPSDEVELIEAWQAAYPNIEFLE